MRRTVARCWLLVAGFLSFLATSDQLRATAFAVEVRPARLELSIPADQITQGTFEISNHNSKAVEVRIAGAPYRFLEENLTFPSAQTWLSFEPSTFTIGAGSSTTVRFSIAPPQNVAFDTAGEYLAAVLIDELPLAEPEIAEGATPGSGHVTVVPRFALPVYLTIQGREKVDLEITEISLRSKETPSQRFLKIDTTLKNRGTVHARPSGHLTILQVTGETVFTSPLGKGLPVLPTGTLLLTAASPMPPPGKYKAVVTVESQSETLLQKERLFELDENGKIH